MLELPVRANLGDLEPTVVPQQRKDVSNLLCQCSLHAKPRPRRGAITRQYLTIKGVTQESNAPHQEKLARAIEMSESIEIRRASERDIPGMIDLLEAVAAEGSWIATESVERDQSAGRIRAALARDDAALYVAIVGGVIVGRLGLYSSWPGLYELGMFVDAKWRGNGVGRLLLDEGIAWARSAGAHKIALEVFPHNHAAIRLYENAGFTREGFHPKHLRRNTGEIWDTISMGLALET
jgi:RimJ/RimL family protein N-acetyltransferase